MKKIYETEFECFTGYYDKDVFRNGKLLVSKVSFNDRMPSYGDEVEIGILDTLNDHYTKIDTTTAWNWQQSSQLSFLDDNTIAYNIFDGDTVKLKILSIVDGTYKIFLEPSMGYSFDSRFYVSTNVEFLSYFRPSYGYQYNKALDPNGGDSVYIVDFESGEKVKILDKNDVIPFISVESGDFISFEHCMFSPNGKKLMVLVRTRGGKSNKSILLSINIKDKKIDYNENISRVSHCCWLDDNKILGYGNRKKAVSSGAVYNMAAKVISPRLRKYIKRILGVKEYESMPFVGDEYFVWDIESSSVNVFESFVGLDDGHPFVLKSESNTIITTDTYPNPLTGDAVLTLVNLTEDNDEGDVVTISTDPTYARIGHRCDLHPKISRDFKFVIIDKVLDSKRCVEVFEL
ncbi:hypothetical protein VCRA2119O147_150064 [Vibrio crassostreae]|uniref:hypothetical protein n=1 Tax=Vibrio crassostreae TaxID=246167 RepID=UPI001BD28138|nr:hypothetical protein [Vibrio crassostreae]CAK2194756.1 hypothetical protein VCRA2113O138_70040 [Vibrio crassostreae]CAK2230628.1 hypothetical protein VCRA2113O137_80171 [Vibrio crassostreae]CAK2231350.1 hypothetical protein VCRA2113O140_80185 [Vibrio crassostreae]CAK2276743.1 hypothetical protein VCRA2119O145_90172 [Vibrio crassostreae]CAK2277758.1 hypothetical protein VCRA2118O144_90171 [Vibrio crassostreae]